jgi:hypothetical protein
MAYVPGTDDAAFAVQYHVALKGLQVGTLLGASVIAPVAFLAVGRRKGRTFFSYLRSEPLVGAAICTPLALYAGHRKLQDEPMSAIEDRAVRIAKNSGQQMNDMICSYSGAAMALVGSIGFRVNPVLGMAQGGGLGIAAGMVIYLVYSQLVDQRV